MIKDALVVKVMHLAYLVQVHTGYCVFIRYAGHVDSLGVTIAESKEHWRHEVLRDKLCLAYRSYRPGKGTWEAALLAKIDVLEQILRDGKIDYDDLDYEDIVTREYVF